MDERGSKDLGLRKAGAMLVCIIHLLATRSKVHIVTTGNLARATNTLRRCQLHNRGVLNKRLSTSTSSALA